MGIRIIDLKPLLKEMKMEKGKIYTFFGRPVIGKTQFAVEMTAFLWFNEGLKGTFITNEKKEKLAESIVKWENYHFLTGPDNLNYIFEKNSYDYEKGRANIICPPFFYLINHLFTVCNQFFFQIFNKFLNSFLC